MVHALSLGLFGKSLALPDFPTDKAVRGAGLSDWPTYASVLEDRFSYENTYFHQEPLLDITAVEDERLESLDFLIASDVFEHVEPPVWRAFHGAHQVLKPGGHLILTVPYSLLEDTIEHFPDLHEYEVIELFDRHCLVNRRRDGHLSFYPDLAFHGGPGVTLEMRMFSEKALERLLTRAGFDQVQILGEPVPEYGIIQLLQCSLPILARKGTQPPVVENESDRALPPTHRGAQQPPPTDLEALAQIATLEARLFEKQRTLEAVLRSRSWRLTAPLRRLAERLPSLRRPSGNRR